MGRRNIAYPEVPAGTTEEHYNEYHDQPQSNRATMQSNPRFSWMDPPAEPPRQQQWQGYGQTTSDNIRTQYATQPLSVVPEQTMSSRSQLNPASPTPMSPATSMGPRSPISPLPHANAHAVPQQYVPQNPTYQQYPGANYGYQENRNVVPTYMAQEKATYSPPEPPRPEASPIPIKEPFPEPTKPKVAYIGPDENPLSPTSPRNMTYQPLTPPPHQASFTPRAPPRRETIKASEDETFHHSMYSCADPGTCLASLFCPCIIYGRIQHRLNLRSEKRDPTNLLGYSALNGSCAAWGVLCGVNVLLTAIQRTRVRKTYGMSGAAGNVVSDCLKSCCCCCCLLAQSEKEIKYRGEQEAREESNSVAYRAPTAMAYRTTS